MQKLTLMVLVMCLGGCASASMEQSAMNQNLAEQVTGKGLTNYAHLQSSDLQQEQTDHKQLFFKGNAFEVVTD